MFFKRHSPSSQSALLAVMSVLSKTAVHLYAGLDNIHRSFAMAGAGIIWFIISVLQKKPMSCPNCKAKGSFTYDY
jgi:hypothetical protein